MAQVRLGWVRFRCTRGDVVKAVPSKPVFTETGLDYAVKPVSEIPETGLAFHSEPVLAKVETGFAPEPPPFDRCSIDVYRRSRS